MFSRSVVSNSLPSHGIFLARLRKWAAISSSNRSSWHRDRTDVSCIGRWILYHQATREAHICQCYSFNSSCPPLQAYLHLILANLREERQLRKHTQWDFGAFPRSHCKSTWGLSGDLRTSDSTPTVGSAKRGESRNRESRGRRGVQGHVQRLGSGRMWLTDVCHGGHRVHGGDEAVPEGRGPVTTHRKGHILLQWLWSPMKEMKT